MTRAVEKVIRIGLMMLVSIESHIVLWLLLRHLQVVVYIYMWKNGFSVEDGPLRAFDDPENEQFLESITQGYVEVYA